MYANDVTPSMQVEWLRSFGHVHKTTMKLIQKQAAMLDRMAKLAHKKKWDQDDFDFYIKAREHADEVMDACVDR